MHVPDVKRTVRDELKRRKQEEYVEHNDARGHYMDLLEYVHIKAKLWRINLIWINHGRSRQNEHFGNC